MKSKKEFTKSDVACREEEILAFWSKNNIFHTSVETPAGKAPSGDFVFYDGPPFATGTPHYGNILAGTIKDAIPRFWSMNGKRVVRRWGWDCHGLPIENIIEKRLGLATKRDIEAIGVKRFNEAAREAVLEYADDWKEIIPRMGRFVEMEHAYRTMDASYTESVWWVFSELNKKGLIYEGFKSMHLCPRCGTTLSNFEVNQGYKNIKDIAVTVKMPLLEEAHTSILIWTTTPWTLPGNMAIAVHTDITYVKVKIKKENIGSSISDEKIFDEYVILAKERLQQLEGIEYEIITEMKGSELIGKRYIPPFDIFSRQGDRDKENAWKIYHAEYVEVGKEGTGAVHIAPAYGEEDMELAQRESIPILHHVDIEGRFIDLLTHFAGQLVKPKDDSTSEISHLDSDIEIIKVLKEKGILVRKENITHSYPHCWRCQTPLLNYATTSWFVRVSDMKDKLVEENNRVSWTPEHVGSNRFGKWLQGARDWAVSRQRYWGAPIPVWKKEGTQEYVVIGSCNELKQYVPKSGNTYHMMRHGESVLNTQWILNGKEGIKNGLTEKGKEQTCDAVSVLNTAKIDIIYCSPLERTKETAMHIAEALGIDTAAIIVDERLKEMQFGVFEGKEVNEYLAYFGSGYNRLVLRPEDGESWGDVKRRVGEFIYEIDAKYSKKNILIVSHGGVFQMLQAVASGVDHVQLGDSLTKDTLDLKNAEVRELLFVPIPHNDDYVLDFHRPYIDAIQLFDADGTKLARVPDVFDCWFESGAMPYAQHHFPFENSDIFNPETGKGYPAEFIAEGLDQTRGWFYSLLVLGTALFGKTPYKNVIVNGLVLSEDGKKMSKSLQNYPDPMELANRVGVDALRYYLISSALVRGEDLNFSEKDIEEQQRKNLGRLHNVLAMYEMFARNDIRGNSDSTHILDQWMIARLHEVIKTITNGYRCFELDTATRPIADLIDDLSVWYLRRSRGRLKGEDGMDKNACIATLRYILKTLSLLMAPVMPFYAEYLFLRVREEKDAISVHLMAWPKEETFDTTLITKMLTVRGIVTKALEARAIANIKVRQPLSTLFLHKELYAEVSAFQDLIKDELNVKELRSDESLTEDLSIDTTITPELKHEGDVRELVRAIQEERKKMQLKPEEQIVLCVSSKTKERLTLFETEVVKTVGAREVRTIEIEDMKHTKSITIDTISYEFDIYV